MPAHAQAPFVIALLVTVLALPGCNTSVGRALKSGCLAGCEDLPEEVPAATPASASSGSPERVTAGQRPDGPGPNPGPPTNEVALVWLHHSTGEHLLRGGVRAALDGDNIALYEITRGEARVGAYVIGDVTNPEDFPRTFNNPARMRAVLTWKLQGRRHDVVMFKSCFPASDIHSEAALARYQRHYRALLPVFRAHPQTLFVPMSTPPLVRANTTPEAAARARRFADWLGRVYSRELPNVLAFDLFDVLAIRPGRAHANTLQPRFASSRTDSHPSPAAGKRVASYLIPWLNRAVRRAKIRRALP